MRLRRRTCLASLTAIALAASVVTVTASQQPAVAGGTSVPPLPRTVTADVLPTWQINGVVWSQVVVGRTVYAAGSFTKARPPGVAVGGKGEIAAAGVFAYDVVTGARVPGFSHQLNGQANVVAASPDGRRVYVGGDFTTVDGVSRGHLAAFDTATNTLAATFAPTASARVSAIAATNSTVYFGGDFGKVGGVFRIHLAAARAADGLLLTTWKPQADDGVVNAMTLTPDHSRVIVGGRFTTLNGVAAVGMGSLDAVTGAVRPWAINTKVQDSGPLAGITSLSADATNVYGGGYKFNSPTGNFEGTFAADPVTGAIRWVNDCHGDTYGVAPVGQVLYVVSHAHDCRPIGGFPDSPVGHRALAYSTYATGTNTGPDSYGWDYKGVPRSSLLTWYPDLAVGTFTGQGQAAWSVAATAGYVVIGGEFPSVNGVRQQGLARFATDGTAPGATAPVAFASGPTASSSAGTTRLSWPSTWDRDDNPLTYQVLRDDDVLPAAVLTQASTFWSLPRMTYADSGQPAGTQHRYVIRVVDPDGNTRSSAAVTVTAAGGTNHAPAARSTTSCLGQTCRFDATGSTDADKDPLSYAWDLGDGTPVLEGPTVSHHYATTGSYTVRLSVRDSRGATTTVTIPRPVRTDPTATSTTLKVVTARAVAGSDATMTATVSPRCDGRVTFEVAGAPITSMAVTSGLSQSPVTGLRAGRYDFQAVFTPTDGGACRASKSPVVTLTVRKADTSTTLRLSARKLPKRGRAIATISVTSVTGLVPGGRVVLRDGSRKLRKVTLHDGSATTRLPRLSPGKHKLRVSYLGDSQLNGSRSHRVTLTVRRTR